MKTHLWKNDLLPGVTLANSTYSDHAFQPHFHDHYVIMIVDDGINEGICEKVKYQVTHKDVLFINPGEIHTGNSYQGKRLQYSALYVDNFFNEQTPEFIKLVSKDPGLVRSIRELFNCVRSNASGFEIEEKRETTFGSLMTYADARKTEPAPDVSSVLVKKVKSFISDHYREQFSLANLATHTGLSPYHLVRSFKKAVGITPFQFLRNFRIERAKYELLDNKRIAEVALNVGFYDQSHFHKHFRLITGVTPREFQQQ